VQAKIGDIIRYTVDEMPPFFGVIRQFLKNDEVVQVDWFDPAAADEIGEYVISWGFGDVWTVVRYER